MAFQITWSSPALADLQDLVRYISDDDPVAAEKFGLLILSKIGLASTFPRIGRIVPEFRADTLREIIVSPYRIVYEIDDETVQLTVLRIWHGARGEMGLDS